MEITISDCVIDSSGTIGIVTDIVERQVFYKCFACDGMEFVFDSEPQYLNILSERFRKTYLREIRNIRRRYAKEEEKKEKEGR